VLSATKVLFLSPAIFLFNCVFPQEKYDLFVNVILLVTIIYVYGDLIK